MFSVKSKDAVFAILIALKPDTFPLESVTFTLSAVPVTWVRAEVAAVVACVVFEPPPHAFKRPTEKRQSIIQIY